MQEINITFIKKCTLIYKNVCDLVFKTDLHA